jgi:hypothetical protein
MVGGGSGGTAPNICIFCPELSLSSGELLAVHRAFSSTNKVRTSADLSLTMQVVVLFVVFQYGCFKY